MKNPADFISFLLDSLHDNLNQINNKPKLKPVKLNEKTNNIGTGTELWENYLLQNKSIITQNITGHIKSTRICVDCNSKSSIFSPYNTLSIPVHDAVSYTHLTLPTICSV